MAITARIDCTVASAARCACHTAGDDWRPHHRLGSSAKQTLNAAAVIGSRFDAELLSDLAATVDLEPLIAAQLVEQVKFTPRAEYVFVPVDPHGCLRVTAEIRPRAVASTSG